MNCDKFTECFQKMPDTLTKHPDCLHVDCLKSCDRRNLVNLEENKKKYVLENNDSLIARFQVDKEMIDSNDVLKCDNLIINYDSKDAIFIELKGTDISHAFEQVDNTIKLLKKGLKDYNLYARIITSNRTNVPKIQTCPQYLALKKNVMKHKGNVKTKANILIEEMNNISEDK